MPVLVKKLGGDPAIIASPLLTTVVDVSAVWIYFEAATKLLHLA
ncbi:MAG: magnesium transporter [Bulleidia sp.]|nr:magnesium transporter [Bulleidia sp.]